MLITPSIINLLLPSECTMRHKKNVCLWILIVGILSSIASCNKSNVTEVKSDMDEEFLISIEDFTSADLRKAKNSENPYDEFGKAHFEGIVYVVKDLKGSVTAPISSIYQSALNFEKTIPSSSPLRSTNNRQLTDEDIVVIYQSVKQNFSFCNVENASPELKEEMKRFSEVFLELRDSNAEDMQTYEKIKQHICAYESSVLKNELLKESDKAIILKGTSTARYSALQWEQPITKLVKQVEPSSAKVAKLKWYHWLIVAGADALATSEGGVSGAVVTSKAVYDIINTELKKDSTSTPKPVEGKTELGKSESN